MITVSHLNFHYQGSRHQVFSDFNLQLAPGRIYGLLGKNGTGKSTLLYLISGLLRPNQGKVTVCGYESRKRDPELLKQIFIVPEEYAMPDMSFHTFEKFMKSFYPNFSEVVLKQCLHDFDMPEEPNLSELSMGQKKKVYMSFAIATGTRLLLMDEPTNGLDIPSKTLFRKVVSNYITDDRTLIISTHNSEIADLAARYSFTCVQPQQMTPDVIYAEPSLQGNAVIMPRRDGEETQVNLELLFNAAILGKLQPADENNK